MEITGYKMGRSSKNGIKSVPFEVCRDVLIEKEPNPF